jgi:spoIIIJ-associated protein
MKKEEKTDKDKLATTESLAKSLLDKLGVGKYKIEVTNDGENDLLRVLVTLDDPGAMIGFKGRTLASFQLILGLMVNASLADYQRILVDINNYRQEQDERLRTIASQAAEKAIETGQEVRLLPMTPYERRLVHITLSDDPQIETFSEGEGSSRQIVIRPKQ